MSTLKSPLDRALPAALEAFLTRGSKGLVAPIGRESLQVAPWGTTLGVGARPVLWRRRMIHADGSSDELASITLMRDNVSLGYTLSIVRLFSAAFYRISMSAEEAAERAHEDWSMSTGTPTIALQYRSADIGREHVMADPFMALVLDTHYAPDWRKRLQLTIRSTSITPGVKP